MAVEIIKIYDDKGHTVLKKRILEHLGVKKDDFVLVELRDDGTAVLKPLREGDILAELKRPEREDEVLKERTKIRFEVS